MKLLPALFLAGLACAQSWVNQTSGTTAGLRGVSAVNAKVVWASGTGGTCLTTTDGGATWQVSKVPGAESLDFRGIRAIDGRTVYLLSSGSGDKARIYKTTDAGGHWTLQFTNPDPKGFFDAIAFWDATHGIVLGDPVGESAAGQFAIWTTSDGGGHWQRQHTPPAVPNEGAFAASNTCLFILGKQKVWFGTGGPQGARVFHSKDRGRSWTVAATPIRNDGPSAGVFSLAFSDARHGVAVGGDYAKDQEQRQNIAITEDGGRTWTTPAAPAAPAPVPAPMPVPKGFRSAVVYVREKNMWLVTGTSGSDVSTDSGKSWKLFDSGSYNAMSFIGTAGWAVGARGRIAQFHAN
ncbi:MAG TPA: hypothetical protein VNY05_35790 [Candidatus Acidoferrales bacterium]|jgi:photosystem II stability/assembly factor-like uncharacterized protein|nr:hypothetical protein [Candidatus Acidoferrales bacterium]